MSNYDSGCRQKAWIGGAAFGVFVFLFLWAVSHAGFAAAALLGLLTFGILGAIFVWAFCTGSGIAFEAPKPAQVPAAAMMPSAPPAAPKAAAPNAAASAAPAPVAAAPAPAPVATAPAAAPVAPPAAVMAPVAAAPDAAAPAAAAPDAAVKAARRKARAEKAAATEAAAAEAAAEAEAAPAEAAPAEAGAKPKGLKAPRKGGADDLKLIEGIGPALEARLHDWGIFHFDQIAAWGVADVAYADNNVPRFKGRASRDKWVAQAKIIVAEGVEAFLERAKTNDY